MKKAPSSTFFRQKRLLGAFYLLTEIGLECVYHFVLACGSGKLHQPLDPVAYRVFRDVYLVGYFCVAFPGYDALENFDVHSVAVAEDTLVHESG